MTLSVTHTKVNAIADWTAAGEPAVYGAVPGFFRPERRYLVELNGNRYQVPESELHKWVAEKTEEVIERVKEPKKRKEIRKLVKNTPTITTKVSESFVQNIVQEANQRIADAIRYANELKQSEDDEDDLEILLLAI